MTPTFIKTPTGPLIVEFLCHDSMASYDAEAGYPGAMSEDAHRWHVHRFAMPSFYRTFIPWVETFSGITRRVDEKEMTKKRAKSELPEKLTLIYESPVKYLEWLFPQLTAEKQEVIRARALAESRKFKINVAPAERIAPIELCYYRRADSLLLQDVDTIKSKLPKFLTLVPDFELAWESAGKPHRESLARLLQKYEENKFEQELD